MPERHHARRDRARRQRPGAGRARPARGREPADLRGHGLALQLQRPGAPLLSAPGLERGRYSSEPAAQGRPQAAEPRNRQAGAAAPAPRGRALTARASRWRKCRPARRCCKPWWRKSTGRALDERIAIARRIRDLWKRTDGVVDVDWYVEDDQPKYRLIVDKEKAALNGISEDDIARTCSWPQRDIRRVLLHVDPTKEDVPLDGAARPRDAFRPRADPGPESRGRTRTTGGAGRTGRTPNRRRRQEHLSQEPHAGHLRDRRCGRRHGEPGLRHPQARPGDGPVQGARRLRHRAAHGGAAHRYRPLLHEVGWRVAHHLRGLPRPRNRLRAPC